MCFYSVLVFALLPDSCAIPGAVLFLHKPRLPLFIGADILDLRVYRGNKLIFSINGPADHVKKRADLSGMFVILRFGIKDDHRP